jgi:biotin synthase-like enzyme
VVYSFEIGPIRPPNESQSLLIRTTRNCAWNKCKFCNSYKGKSFELRSVEEIERDIATARVMYDKLMEITLKSGHSGGMQKVIGLVLKDPPNQSFRNVALWLYSGGENVFLQDADCLVTKTDDLRQVLRTLTNTFPKIKRITGYARSKSAAKKKLSELLDLKQAGLSRLHIGLESGSDAVLEDMKKGETAEQHVKGGRKIIEAGISLSEYIILGLGGKELSSSHARATARVLNEIDPEFIRVRTLVVNSHVSLSADIASGMFLRATDEEIVREERTLLENLNVNSYFYSDHISNLLPELQGKLPEDRGILLSILDRFTALSQKDKENFMVGRRVGLYKYLKDLEDPQRYELTEQVKFKLMRGQKFDPRVVFSLMEEFI